MDVELSPEDVSDEGIAEVEIPADTPLAYRLDENTRILEKNYLGKVGS